MTKLDSVIHAQNHLYNSCGYSQISLIPEPEGGDYYAHNYTLANKSIAFRISKITPTKSGQFVTLWKRNSDGIIAPLDEADNIHLCVINTIHEDRVGQFVLPKEILVEKKIFSQNGTGGKRAMRVYSPWDSAHNKQAQLTQKWLDNYFIDITPGEPINIELAHSLYGL